VSEHEGRAATKLTIYFSERDRVGGSFLADALFDVYERHGLRASVLLRGSAGFGDRHGAHSERSLTLSETLPAVSVAIDTEARIQSALPDVLKLAEHGLVSLERARLIDSAGQVGTLPTDGTQLKLTIYGGRGVRTGGEPGYVSAVEKLRGSKAAGAAVLLGVDGTLGGERRRARFFGRNAGVPVMVLVIGDASALGPLLPSLMGLFEQPAVTVERVRVCRVDGVSREEPRVGADLHDASGLPVWQKLMIHAEEQARSGGRPLHSELLRRLRGERAAGATTLCGVLGFYGDRGPFADRLLALKRHAPMVTVLVDTPEQIHRLWPVVEELTGEAGLVTSEMVPAFHREPGRNRGA
jgi:PII-like signaling protein